MIYYDYVFSASRATGRYEMGIPKAKEERRKSEQSL
jgi:hypothetical protein